MKSDKDATDEPSSSRGNDKDATISLRLSSSDDRRLAETARYRGTTKSDLIREAVASYLVHDRGEPAPGSFLARARDLAGCIEAEEDLSTNPRHLEGYGRE